MDWRNGEPKLTDMLDDPIVHAIMQADGQQRRELCDILLKAMQARMLSSAAGDD